MKSLQKQSLLIIFICFCLNVVLAFYAIQHHLQIQHFDSYVSKSQNLVFELLEYSSVGSHKHRKVILEQYADLTPELRQKNLNTLLKYKKPPQKTLQQFIENERNFQTHYKSKKTQSYQSLVLGIVCLVFINLVSSLWLLVRLKNNVFNPLKSLTQKMQDFLSNNYSYKFEMPKNNEVGVLEKNFNELAQTVMYQFRQLKKLDEAKSEFISITSHELRTPLTSISGALGLLKKILPEKEEKSHRFLNIAEQETFRLIRLVNDFLDLAKIESQQLPLDKRWLTLYHSMEQASQAVHGLCSEKDIAFELNLDKNFEVHVDADRLHQVLTNLISNAIKHSPQGSKISLRAHETEQGIYIGVKDYGEGISPEDQSRIFDKFTQLGDVHSAKQGTGLGLAITKALVEEHGSQLGLQSEPGKGCEFYFVLPEYREIKIEKSA